MPDRIAEVTGYKTDGNFEKLDAAGYKDWALQSMKIPSLTVEIGKPDSPLPWWCFEEIYRENRRVWEEMLLDLEKDEQPPNRQVRGLKGEDKVFLLFLWLSAKSVSHLSHLFVDYL